VDEAEEERIELFEGRREAAPPLSPDHGALHGAGRRRHGRAMRCRIAEAAAGAAADGENKNCKTNPISHRALIYNEE